MSIKTNRLLACPECDLLQREIALAPGAQAECGRCGAELFRCRPGSLERTLAFALAAAVALALANAFPLMALDAQGMRTSATILDTAGMLLARDMPSVAVLVFATTILFPALQLAALLYLLVPLRLGVAPPALGAAFRLAEGARPWAMLEVFLLGTLVSLVKLTDVASVEVGLALWFVGAYILLVAAALSAFEPQELWRRVDALGPTLPYARREWEA